MVPPEVSIPDAVVWVDAQLSPVIAKWLTEDFAIKAHSLRSLGLRDADDLFLFEKARQASAVILTKDIDLLKIQERLGQPPKIIHLTCGNTSSRVVRAIMQKHFSSIMDSLFNKNEPFVEIAD